MNTNATQADNADTVDNSEMTVEESKASLGLSTRLSEQFLMQQMGQGQIEGSEMPVEASMDVVDPIVEDDLGSEEKLDLEGIKEEIQQTVKEAVKGEMKALKKEIEHALENEES